MVWSTLVGIAAIILCFRRPKAERPYRMPFYPITPILLIVISVGLTSQLLINNPRDTLVGLGLLVLSVPVYFVWRRVRRE